MQSMDVHKREAVPHGATDDWIRVMFRQDRAEHVERTDVGRCLAASVRVHGEDEICKRLPEFHLSPRFPLGLGPNTQRPFLVGPS